MEARTDRPDTDVSALVEEQRAILQRQQGMLDAQSTRISKLEGLLAQVVPAKIKTAPPGDASNADEHHSPTRGLCAAETRGGGTLLSRASVLRSSLAAVAGVAIAGEGYRIANAARPSKPFTVPSLKVSGPKPKSGVGIDVLAAKGDFDIAIRGSVKGGTGVLGTGDTGVRGKTAHHDGVGVHGSNDSGTEGFGSGVAGTAKKNPGVIGVTQRGPAGVHGINGGKEPGVLGESNFGYGVKGVSSGGDGDGVYGEVGPSSNGAGVRGVNAYGGSGVYAQSSSYNNGASAALYAEHTDNWYGLYARSESGVGGVSYSSSGPQLKLDLGGDHLPSGDFLDGSFFADWLGNLYYYKNSSAGWIQLA